MIIVLSAPPIIVIGYHSVVEPSWPAHAPELSTTPSLPPCSSSFIPMSVKGTLKSPLGIINVYVVFLLRESMSCTEIRMYIHVCCIPRYGRRLKYDGSQI